MRRPSRTAGNSPEAIRRRTVRSQVFWILATSLTVSRRFVLITHFRHCARPSFAELPRSPAVPPVAPAHARGRPQRLPALQLFRLLRRDRGFFWSTAASSRFWPVGAENPRRCRRHGPLTLGTGQRLRSNGFDRERCGESQVSRFLAATARSIVRTLTPHLRAASL